MPINLGQILCFFFLPRLDLCLLCILQLHKQMPKRRSSRELERCLGPSAQAHEEAWERALQVPPGWLRDPGIEAPAPENAASGVPSELLAALGMQSKRSDSGR